MGGFDEYFGSAEDFDFTWRLTDAGYRLRWVPDAVVQHDWGTPERQLRRAFFYGKGGCRLLRKHPHRIPESLRQNAAPVAYALDWLMFFSDKSKVLTLGIVAVVGVVTGSALVALMLVLKSVRAAIIARESVSTRPTP